MRATRVLWICCLVMGCTGLRSMTAQDPLDARAHNDLGVAYEQRGENSLAIREYERAAQLEKGWAQPVANLGNVYAAQGQWDEALAKYREALDREPTHAEAMNNVAWALLELGRPEEALPYAERAVATDGCGAGCLHTLAMVQADLGQTSEALATVRKALQASPDPLLRSELEEAQVALERRVISP